MTAIVTTRDGLKTQEVRSDAVDRNKVAERSERIGRRVTVHPDGTVTVR